MGLGLLAWVLTAAAIAFYWSQSRLSKRLPSLINQAKEAEKKGQLEAAEEACLAAVACARGMWLRRGDALLLAQYDLAAVYFQQRKLELAEQTAAQAFATMQKLNRASSATVPLVCLIAQIHKELGKDLSACPVFELAIQLLKRIYGSRSIKVGEALHGLAVTLIRVGVGERAVGVLEECIPIIEEHRGKDHRDVAAALTNLGLAQSQIEHYADAEQTQRRVIAMREATLGLDDPEVAQALNNLAVTYKRQERIPEALDCLRRSLAIREAKLGPDHPNVGLVLNNLGNCLRLEKKFAEAESALTRAKAILENPPHKSYATVIDSFAGLRAAQGRYEEASLLYAECLKIHQSRPSSNLRELAETCERYADVLYKLQKEKQADALMAKVTELRGAREKLLTPAV